MPYVPSNGAMQQIIKRQRTGVCANPPDFFADLDENLIKFDNKTFLLKSDIYNDDRMLIFGTKKTITVLSRCKEWLMDGTFSVVPRGYKQLYTIHGIVGSGMIFIFFYNLSKLTKNSFLGTLDLYR